MLKINSSERICIIRSAFLGDWITIVPFYLYLLNDCNISKKNISTVIINNKGVNPIAMIFGEESELSKNTKVINTNSLQSTIKSAIAHRGKFNGKLDKIIYLPFAQESKISSFKKYLISFVFGNIDVERFGFNLLNKKETEFSPSQYISYFNNLRVNFKFEIDTVNQFLLSESVRLRKRQFGSKKKIAIYPHSKLKMKIWSYENYISLIKILNDRFDINFLLLGSNEDFDYNEFILTKLSPNIRIRNIAGLFNIPETLSELSDIDLMIANDGAPVHFASLLNLPVIGLYTYKEPIGAWDPFLSNRYISIRTEVLCKNCYKEYCPNPICIQSISIYDVFNSCLELLENNESVIRHNKLLIPATPLHYCK